LQNDFLSRRTPVKDRYHRFQRHARIGNQNNPIGIGFQGRLLGDRLE
jgi:hypothetical protein